MRAKILLSLCSVYFLFNLSVKAFSQKIEWDSTSNEKQYFDSLFATDEAAFLSEFEYPFLLLLDEKQKKSYLALDSLQERKLFIESYWKMMNPNPILPENDRLLDFTDRYIHARKYFPSSEPPFFDDRGRYYIKYGEPTDRFRDMGGQKTVRLFQNRSVYRYLSRLYSGFPPGMYYWVYPNESWVYRNIGQDFIIHFVKESTDFHEVRSITKAFSTGISKNVAWYWNDLIQIRAYLSPSLIRAANNLLQLENELLIAAYTGQVVTRGGHLLPHRKIFEQKSIYEADVMMNKRNPPVFIHYPVQAIDELKFFSDVVQFRGPNDSTRVELSFLSPFENNISRNKSLTVLDTINIEYQCLMRDFKFDPVVRVRNTQRYPIKFFESESFCNAVGKLSFIASPQQGDLTLQIKEMTEGRIGFSKQPFKTRDFSGRDLMISDIQFFTEVTDQSLLQVLPTVNKQNVIVAPYPYEKIHKSSSVFCYFEIYNLQSAIITNEYEISLEVLTDKSRERGFKKFSKWLTGAKDVSISVVHSRPVTDDTTKELISIDFSNLTNGAYRLQVTVTDSKDKAVTTSVEKKIILTD